MNEERPPADQSADPPDAPADASAGQPREQATDTTGDVETLVAELAPMAEAAASAVSDEVDTEFSEDLDPETRAFGAAKPQAIVCQWCNGPLDSADLDVCPHCGSRLKPTEEDLVVPGVTTLSVEAARALELVEIQRNREAAKAGEAMYATPSLAGAAAVVPAPDEAAVEAATRPPDEEVRRLMLQMELEARQARAMAAARSDIEDIIVADADAGAAADPDVPAVAAADPDVPAVAAGEDSEGLAAADGTDASAAPTPEASMEGGSLPAA
jgi:hypothetical protein